MWYRRLAGLLLGVLAAAPVVVVAVVAVVAVAAPGPTSWAKPSPLDLDGVVDRYRESVVLLSDDTTDDVRRDRLDVVGQILFDENRTALLDVDERLADDLRASGAQGFVKKPTLVTSFLDRLEKGGWHDGDKLVFRDTVAKLAAIVDEAPSSPKADVLRKRIDDDQAALDRIAAKYREEAKALLDHLGTRGMVVHREQWDAYVAFVRTVHTADDVLEAYTADTDVLGSGGRGGRRHDEPLEIYGFDLPDKTFVLTFDDGPDATYTPQILDILDQNGIKSIFFEVGKNVGTDTDGTVALSKNADLTRKILADGHLVGNHTLTHANLPKLDEAGIAAQIDTSKAILDDAAGMPLTLFRPPYGARDARVLAALDQRGERAFIWDVDSRDWADPVPESIAANVMQQVEAMRRGVILFHDVHSQTVTALPMVLEKMKAEGYQLVLWDGKQIVGAPTTSTAPGNPPGADDAKPAPVTAYTSSWAVVIGVDAYQKWPKLAYATTDAKGVRDVLVGKYGFPADHVITLLDGDATRANILKTLGDELPKKVGPNDRVLVFYAGHGTTRKLPDGGQKGFIVPVDADTSDVFSTAISMSTLDDIDAALPAKHVLYVMDACYSGIALTRGGASGGGDPERYLQEITKRPARQILTAGGADEEVSDYGPGNHSIFTWTLLQGLDGQADLNGDGVIVASELGSFVAPRVSSLSHQTPAFGNLSGSAGGEFVLELGTSSELLSQATHAEDDPAQAKALAEARALAAKNDELQKQLAEMQAKLTAIEGTRGDPASADPTVESQRWDAWGLELFHDGKYPEALSAFEKAADLDPKNVQAVNNLGYVYYKLQRYADAASWLEKTVALDPNRAVAWLNLGDAYQAIGQTPKAVDAWKKYLALAPGSRESKRVQDAVTQAGG